MPIVEVVVKEEALREHEMMISIGEKLNLSLIGIVHTVGRW